MTNHPPAAQLVRNLLRGRDRAALATALPDGAGGWPYASLTLVAVDHDLAPILLLSDLADHSKAIASDNRVSLLFDDTAGLDQPLTGPRVSLLGRAMQTADGRLKSRFLAHHPEAAMYAGFGDFKFYRVGLERAHLVGGFGRIQWLAADDLIPVDRHEAFASLAADEGEILNHMNTDHADVVQLFARRLLGLEGGEWKMAGIDAEGIDLRRVGAKARLAFDIPLSGSEEARSMLVRLAAKARID